MRRVKLPYVDKMRSAEHHFSRSRCLGKNAHKFRKAWYILTDSKFAQIHFYIHAGIIYSKKTLRKLCLEDLSKYLKHLKTFKLHNFIMCSFFFKWVL